MKLFQNTKRIHTSKIVSTSLFGIDGSGNRTIAR